MTYQGTLSKIEARFDAGENCEPAVMGDVIREAYGPWMDLAQPIGSKICALSQVEIDTAGGTVPVDIEQVIVSLDQELCEPIKITAQNSKEALGKKLPWSVADYMSPSMESLAGSETVFIKSILQWGKASRIAIATGISDPIAGFHEARRHASGPAHGLFSRVSTGKPNNWSYPDAYNEVFLGLGRVLPGLEGLKLSTLPKRSAPYPSPTCLQTPAQFETYAQSILQ